MKTWQSISHPLKPLLYVEWVLLTLAILYPWLLPHDTLQLMLHRDGVEGSIAVELGTSNPMGLLIPLTWIVTCIVCWRIPSSNKSFIAFIVGCPMVIAVLSIIPHVEPFPPSLNWVLLSIVFGAFSWLGTQLVQQKILLNQWLYTAVEFLLIWVIFILISALQSRHGPHLESLLLLHLIALIRASLMFTGKSRGLAIAAFFFSYHSVSIFISMVWSDIMRIIDRPVTLYANDIRKVLSSYVFNVTIVFTLVTALLILLVNGLISERRSREQLAQAHSQLRQFAQRIEDQTLLEERNRIAREIHDSLGHTLTAQSIQLENALVYFNPDSDDRAYPFITQAQKLSHTALQDIRRSVSNIRNNLLMGKSFDQAVEDLIREFQILTSCEIHYQSQVTAQHISIEIQTAFYRIIQEALTNVLRHSKSQIVMIELTASSEIGTTNDLLRLTITDNGNGFRVDQTTSGFGLQGIRERAAAIGGTLQIRTAPHQGCTVQVDVPIYSWLNLSGSLSLMTKP